MCASGVGAVAFIGVVVCVWVVVGGVLVDALSMTSSGVGAAAGGGLSCAVCNSSRVFLMTSVPSARQSATSEITLCSCLKTGCPGHMLNGGRPSVNTVIMAEASRAWGVCMMNPVTMGDAEVGGPEDRWITKRRRHACGLALSPASTGLSAGWALRFGLEAAGKRGRQWMVEGV